MKPLFLGGSVIDSEYRDNISVILTNFSSFAVDIKKGEKIAQIVFLQKEEVTFEEVDEFNDTTIDGINGFGSTDSKQTVFFFRKKKMTIKGNILFDFSVFNDIVGKENSTKKYYIETS